MLPGRGFRNKVVGPDADGHLSQRLGPDQHHHVAAEGPAGMCPSPRRRKNIPLPLILATPFPPWRAGQGK